MRARFNALSRSQRIILGVLGASIFVVPPAFGVLAPSHWKPSPPGKVRGLSDRYNNFTKTSILLNRISQAAKSETYNSVQMTYEKDYDSGDNLQWMNVYKHKVVNWHFQEKKWWNGISQCVHTSPYISLNANALGDKYLRFSCKTSYLPTETWSISIDKQRGGDEILQLFKQHFST